MNNSKSIFNIAFSFLILLLIASVILYKERMLFVDPCFVSFGIINTEWFIFSEHRYAAFVTQIFPLISTYLGLPLKLILILYSASFYIFYSVVAFIVGYKWKQYSLATLLVLYFFLMVGDVYFWPNNEVHQGISWMVLFLGYFEFLKGRSVNIFQHLLLIVFLFLATNSHLLVVIPLSFYWGYYLIQTVNWKAYILNKRFITYSMFIIGFIALRYYLSMESWYDGQKLEGVKHISISSIWQSFFSGHSITISKAIVQNYWLMIPLFGLGVFALVKQNKHLLLSLVLGASIGYYALVCITYPDAFDRSFLFYIESEWLAFSMIIATPFIMDFVPLIKSKKILIITFFFIFVVRSFYIFDAYQLFHQRFVTLNNITQSLIESNHSKILIPKTKELNDVFIMDWGLPIESMMLSKLKGYPVQSTFKMIENNIKISEARDSFYSSFKLRSIDYLNPDYFKLDTTEKYNKIKLSDIYMK